MTGGAEEAAWPRTSIQEPEYGGARVRARVVAVVACGVVVGVVLVLVRGEPRVWGDSGIWLSVAARLLEGDRLYVDVFDNKDPLFFYTYAGALWVGGWRAPFALDAFWLVLAAIATASLLAELRVSRTATMTGLLVYPLALTAAWYEPGATLLPALALAPLAAWLWLRGWYPACGAVVVVAMLFKLNLALVVVAAPAALLVLGVPRASRRRQVAEATAGGAAALVAATAVLAARGELGPYLETISYNVYYADAGVQAEGGLESIRAHLSLVREFFLASGRWQAPAALLAVVAFLATVAFSWLRQDRDVRRLAAVAVATLLAAFVTLALTAIFREHLQVLAYPTALAAATVTAVASRAAGERAGAVVAAACIVFAAWSTLKHEELSRVSLRTWSTEPASTPAIALEEARASAFEGARSVTYMVFGRNTEDGHAAFVSDNLRLTCRLFHQYPFYKGEQLEETLDCTRNARPLLLLVTQSFYDPIPGVPRWEAFVSSVRELLDSEYELVTKLGQSQVWRRIS
jgi:hypothetical protein